jgi:phage shock protein C
VVVIVAPSQGGAELAVSCPEGGGTILYGMSTQLPPEPGRPGPEPSPAAPAGGQRVVRRSRRERVIAGVCGGIGHYLGVDPVLLRIAFMILALANGLGVVAYVVAWVAIPEEQPGQPVGPSAETRREMGRLVLGGALVVLGLVLLLDRLAPNLDELFWPVAVVAVGVAVMLVGLRR